MRTWKQLITIALVLALLLGLIPGVAVSAVAEEIEIVGGSPEEFPAGAGLDLDGLTLEGQTETVTFPALNAAALSDGTAEPFLDAGYLIETDFTKLNGANWMSGISGDRYLNEINIPYTHDAAMKEADTKWDSAFGASVGEAFAKTQELYIDEQLEAGVRIFDLRLRNENLVRDHWYSSSEFRDDGSNLWLVHGKSRYAGTFYAEDHEGHHLSLAKVLGWVKDFLTDHPTETVVLEFGLELPPDDFMFFFSFEEYEEFKDICISRLKNHLLWNLDENPSTGKPYLYVEPGTKRFQPYTHMPQLKDCRGQVVVMYAFDEMRDVIGGMNSRTAPVKTVEKVPGDNTVFISEKIENVRTFFSDSKHWVDIPGEIPETPSTTLFQLDTNSRADDLTTMAFYPKMKPLIIAEEVHAALFKDGEIFDRPGRDTATYFGWVKMDGATEKDCRYVWKANFPRYLKDNFTYYTVTVDPGNANDNKYAAHYANYETQKYTVLNGTKLVMPEEVYDVWNHITNYREEYPYFRYWEVTDAEGNKTNLNIGDTYRVTGNVTITPVYGNESMTTRIFVDWIDGDDADGLRPKTLDIKCKTNNVGEQTITYRSDVYWFTGDLTEICPIWYRVRTDAEPQGVDEEGFYRYEISGTPGGWMTITMIHTPVKNNKQDVSGGIVWDDHDNSDEVRPNSVNVRLLANGTPTGKSMTVKYTEENDWGWTFKDCPIYADGREIRYSVTQDAIPSYSTWVQGMTIHNSHEATHVSYGVEIVWKDDENERGLRPSNVSVALNAKRTGDDTYQSVSETEINDRSWYGYLTAWGKGIQGEDVEFKVVQQPLEDYDTVVEWVDEDQYDNNGNIAGHSMYWKVTNTLKPQIDPVELEGAYESGYDKSVESVDEHVDGDVIGFSTGVYITADDAEPAKTIRVNGSHELVWRKYEAEQQQHLFMLGETEVRIKDTGDNASARPWGIQVTDGDGTEKNPYTFKVLHNKAVSYWEASARGGTGVVSYAKHYRTDYEIISGESGITELQAGKWYVVDEGAYVEGEPRSVHINHRLTVTGSGTAHLILRYGTTLNVNGGIGVSSGTALEIYPERNTEFGSGSLEVEVRNREGAAIGGTNEDGSRGCGTITIHKGIIHVDSLSAGCAPIGGCSDSEGTEPAAGGTLNVYGGRLYINANGYTATAAIGNNVDVNVYGGAVLAKGYKSGDENTILVAIKEGTITPYNGLGVYEGYLMEGNEPDANAEIQNYNNPDNRKHQMTIRPGHHHNFYYQGEDNFITATCNKRKSDGTNCSLENKSIKLTLSTPALKRYNDGGDPNVILNNLDDFVLHTHQNITQNSINYYVSGKDGYTLIPKGEGAPTLPGNYKAELVLTGVTTSIIIDDDQTTKTTTGTVKAMVFYTIDKAPVEITKIPIAAEITYGQTLKDSELTGGVVDPDILGKFAWAAPATAPTVADSETMKYTVTFTPNDLDKYEIATCEVTVKVNPAEQNVTPPVALNPTYNGEEQALVSKGSAVNGVMLYAPDPKPETDTDEGWSHDIPVGTDVAEYTVWYKVFGNGNYSDLEAKSVTAKIVKADASGEVKANALTYNEQPQALVTIVKEEGGKLQYFVGETAPTETTEWSDTATGTNAGTYKVWYRVVGDKNHNTYIAPEPVEVTIAKAVVKVSKPPVASAITYGQALAASALTGGEVKPSVPGDFAWTEKNEVPTVADSAKTQYEVTFVPKDSVNYEAEADKSYATVVVVPADPTVTPPVALNPKYNGEAQALVEKGIAEHGVMMYALGKTAPASKDSWNATVPTGTETGDYIVWYKVFGDTNYNDTEAAPLYVTIYPAQSGDVKADTLVYNGEAQNLVVPGTVVGGTLQYFVGDDAPTEEADWSEEIPTGIDAGDYKVWYRVKGDANHNDGKPGSVTATIAKAPITPGVSITGWTYGEEANKPAVTGNPGNGEVTVTYSAEKEGAYTTAVPTQAGSWFVKAEVAETDNYEGATTAPLNFNIAKAQISIFADNKAGSFGDALQELTWRFGEKTVNGDDLGISLTTTATADSKPGDYPITVKWSGNANYSAIVKDGVYTIRKRSVTIAANGQTIQSGGNIATGTDQVTATGLADGHKLSAVTLTPASTTGNAPTDEVTMTASTITASGAKIVDAMGNDVTDCYAITYTQGALTIVTAPAAKPEDKPEDKPEEQQKPEDKPEDKPEEQQKPEDKPEDKPEEQQKPEDKPEEQKPTVNPDYTLLAKMTTSGTNKLKMSWTKVKGAQGYDVFFKKCDGKQTYTRVTITSKLNYTIKGLKVRMAYKGYVLAWYKSGDRKYYIGSASPVVHAITSGYNFNQCNAKSVKLNRSSLTLKLGKSKTLKATVKGVKSNKTVLQHALPVRYYSSDANIAKVNKNGKVTAVGKGSCTIYAIANNGVRASVKVKVK